jgi:hypothetical protein
VLLAIFLNFAGFIFIAYVGRKKMRWSLGGNFELPTWFITLLRKETIFAYGECRKNFNDTVRFLLEHYPNVGFTKCKVKRVVNLFEDTKAYVN